MRWSVVVGIAVGAVLLASCSGGTTSSSGQKSSSGNTKSAQLAWLNGTAEPINKKLNNDQSAINAALAKSDAYGLLTGFAAMDTDLAAAEERLADIDEGKTGVTAKAPIVVAWNAMIEASSDYSTACGKSMTTANPSQSDEGACTSANGTLTTSIASWNDAIGALKGTTPTQDTLAPPTTSAG